MSSGGVFNSVIKSNKSIMLDKTKRFRKTPKGFDQSKSPQLNFKTATTEQLKEIRKRIQLENKQHRIWQLIVLGIPLIILIPFAIYLNH